VHADLRSCMENLSLARRIYFVAAWQDAAGNRTKESASPQGVTMFSVL